MKKYIVACLMLSVSILNAQSLKQDGAMWFCYGGQYKVAKHWGLSLDVQYRGDEKFQQNRQTFMNTGVAYLIDPHQSVSLAYGYIATNNTKFGTYFSEHRIVQQYLYILPWYKKHFTTLFRFRVEERFIDKLGYDSNGKTAVVKMVPTAWARFFVRNVFNIVEFKSKNNFLYGVVQDELLVNLAKTEINNNIFDQNRFSVGLGISHHNTTRIEATYMNQYVNPTAGPILHNTFVFSIIQNLSFMKE